jgi:hypothetical protein
MISATDSAAAPTREKQLRCPHCRSNNLRNSHLRSPLDLAFLLFLHHPIRCRACDHRFLRWLWVKAVAPTQE